MFLILNEESLQSFMTIGAVKVFLEKSNSFLAEMNLNQVCVGDIEIFGVGDF